MYVHFHIGLRLADYRMLPYDEIRRLIGDFVRFAKDIAAGDRQGKIPVAVDLDNCTVQREGETMDRAMRPDVLPPLYLYPVDDSANPRQWPGGGVGYYDGDFTMKNLRGQLRVDDVLSPMEEVCRICGLIPVEGTRIASLVCGRSFHYHCIARRLLEVSNSCPICRHHPAFDESPNLKFRDPLLRNIDSDDPFCHILCMLDVSNAEFDSMDDDDEEFD